jgi:hypothetical protein
LAPLFVDPSSGDWRIAADSPCIDAADNTAVPDGVTTDVAGDPRFHDDDETQDTGNPDGIHPPVDMGAYEFQGISTPCPGDTDGDDSVDFGDLLITLAQWGPCPPSCLADFDGDGVVGFAGLLIVLSGWGACP